MPGAVPVCRAERVVPVQAGGAMGGRNKKPRAGSAAHTACAATAAARARAAAEAGAAAAAAAEAGNRAAPRPPPACKEPRVKQGTGPRGVRRPGRGAPGATALWGGGRGSLAAEGCSGWPVA